MPECFIFLIYLKVRETESWCIGSLPGVRTLERGTMPWSPTRCGASVLESASPTASMAPVTLLWVVPVCPGHACDAQSLVSFLHNHCMTPHCWRSFQEEEKRLWRRWLCCKESQTGGGMSVFWGFIALNAQTFCRCGLLKSSFIACFLMYIVH